MKFDLKALYALYPPRSGPQRYLAAYAFLRKKLKDQDEYDRLKSAILNYSQHIYGSKKHGSQFVISFNNFVRFDWEEWIPKQVNINTIKHVGEEFGL